MYKKNFKTEKSLTFTSEIFEYYNKRTQEQKWRLKLLPVGIISRQRKIELQEEQKSILPTTCPLNKQTTDPG